MKSQFQNWTQSEPVDGRTLTKRWPANDRRIHCRPQAIDKSPNGHRWASWWSSAGHWLGIGRKFGYFQWKSTGGRTVSRRRPSGARWLTLRHGSRSRKSGGELPISKNRHPAKIYRSPRDLCFLGRRFNGDVPWDEGQCNSLMQILTHYILSGFRVITLSYTDIELCILLSRMTKCFT